MQQNPEHYPHSSRKNLDKEEDNDLLVRFTWLGISLAMMLISIPILDAIIQDPEIRWGFLLMILILCASLLVVKTYPRMGYRPAPDISATLARDDPDAAERELMVITNALHGAPYSQMLAYLELREMLVRRFMLLHHLPRAEAEARLADPKTAKLWIRDEQLLWLLTFDFKRAYDSESLETPQGQIVVQEFNRIFPELLRKLEALK